MAVVESGGNLVAASVAVVESGGNLVAVPLVLLFREEVASSVEEGLREGVASSVEEGS